MHCQVLTGWVQASVRAGSYLWGEYVGTWPHKMTARKRNARNKRNKAARKARRRNRG